MQTWNNLSYRVCGVGGLVYCFRWGVPPSSAGNQLLADLLKVILCEQSPLVVPARSLKNLFGEYQTKALLVILLPFFLWTAHLPYICVFWAPLLGKEECWVKPDHNVTWPYCYFSPLYLCFHPAVAQVQKLHLGCSTKSFQLHFLSHWYKIT